MTEVTPSAKETLTLAPPEPRCRVCRNDHLRPVVNRLLAQWLPPAWIVRAIEQDNAKLHERDRITYNSVRRHAERHHPIQKIARIAYRLLLQHRGRGETVSWGDCVDTAIEAWLVARNPALLVDQVSAALKRSLDHPAPPSRLHPPSPSTTIGWPDPT